MTVVPQAQGLVVTLAVCLLSTIAVECTVAAAAFRVRNLHGLAVVALAQVVTNPAVVLASTLAYGTLPSQAGRWVALVMLELGALATEALLYGRAGVVNRPWRLSVACNLASFLVGLAVQGL